MSENGILQIVKLSDNTVTPTKGSTGAAGYNLYSAYNYILSAYGKILVKSDLQIKVPQGIYGCIAPRSGLSVLVLE